VNVFCGIISNSSSCETKSTLSIKIGEAQFEETLTDLFAGQQRVLLSDACTVKIINAFLRGETVIISIERDQATFQPANFQRQWGKLLLK
jgi:hypothetical protein